MINKKKNGLSLYQLIDLTNKIDKTQNGHDNRKNETMVNIKKNYLIIFDNEIFILVV